MLRVCLTGGIASGKSLVTDRFQALGAPVADSDVAARVVVEPGSRGLAGIVEAFGDGVLDAGGRLDRKALRALIFRDRDAKRRLEGILHPLIREHVTQELEAFAAHGHVYALHVIPLLVETGQPPESRHVLVVDAPPSIQIDRLIRRDRCSAKEARSIIGQQASRWQRLSIATDVIDNGDTVAPGIALDPQVLALHHKYSRIASHT